MTRTWIAAGILLALPMGAQAPSKPGGAAESKKKTVKRSAKVTTMIGCVDQRDESFFLTDDKELKPIARLEGDDPERKSYAKYLGHKVRVTGTVAAGGELPAIRVREIKTVSEICAPNP